MVLSQCPTRVYPEDAWVSFFLLFLRDFIVILYFVLLEAYVQICAAPAVEYRRLVLRVGGLTV